MLHKGDYLILLATLVSLLFSVSLWFGVGLPMNKEAGAFVGIWVPSVIGVGIYYQVVIRRR